MKILGMAMLLIFFVWAEDMSAKMVLSSHIYDQEAAQNLNKLEIFFQTNQEASRLKSAYNLQLGIEPLDKYWLVVIKPIKTDLLKFMLQALLKESYPDSFIVNSSYAGDILAKHPGGISLQAKKDIFPSSADRELIALVLLAVLGLFLVYRSARQFKKIRILQKELSKYQLILEDRVGKMGANCG